MSNFKSLKISLLSILIGSLIGVFIRIYDVSQSPYPLLSFHSIDILILIIFIIISLVGIIKVKAKSKQSNIKNP